MTEVNPEILTWARQTAGLTREEAVRKLGIRNARGMAAVDRLAALEAGENEPTRPLLIKMAKQYRRPLLTFYLRSPPRKADRGADFRSLPRGPLHRGRSPLGRTSSGCQGSPEHGAMSAGGKKRKTEPAPFVGARTIADGTARRPSSRWSGCSELITGTIALSEMPGLHSRLLREHAEAAGVFVMLKGDLGSHHTAIEVETFRGFAIADDIVPFVVINDRDSPSAWSFHIAARNGASALGANRRQQFSSRKSNREVLQRCRKRVSAARDRIGATPHRPNGRIGAH